MTMTRKALNNVQIVQKGARKRHRRTQKIRVRARQIIINLLCWFQKLRATSYCAVILFILMEHLSTPQPFWFGSK